MLKLPVVPKEFTVSKPQANEVFETVSGRELRLIGTPKLKSISWSSFFPRNEYPFLRDTTYKGFGYPYIIDTWISKKLPIRLVITDTPINMAVAVESFEYSIGSSGDLEYSITLGEVRLI